MKGQIHITKADQIRLLSIMDGMKTADERLQRWLDLLEHELDRANVVESHAIPRGTVTLHSRVRLLDLDSGESLVYKLVTPSEVNSASGNLSILAPIGIALLGYSEGDRFECETPGGTRRFLVEKCSLPTGSRLVYPADACWFAGRRGKAGGRSCKKRSRGAARLTSQHRKNE